VVARIRVRLSRVLDLTDPKNLAALGLGLAELTDDDVTTTRDLGEAANYLGYEAILAPSAAGPGFALAILVANRAASSEVVVIDAGEDES
jgi:RES domain-containing protein